VARFVNVGSYSGSITRRTAPHHAIQPRSECPTPAVRPLPSISTRAGYLQAVAPSARKLELCQQSCRCCAHTRYSAGGSRRSLIRRHFLNASSRHRLLFHPRRSTLFGCLRSFAPFAVRCGSVPSLLPRPRVAASFRLLEFSLCCRPSSLTGTAFPPPVKRVSGFGPGFPGFRYHSSSDSCWASVFVFSSYDLPLSRNPAGLVGNQEIRGRLSPIRTPLQRILASSWEPTYPHAPSRRFAFARNDHPPTLFWTLSRFRPLASLLACIQAVPLPHRCRIPFVRAPGQTCALQRSPPISWPCSHTPHIPQR